MSKTIVAMFPNYDYADRAATNIKNEGLRTDDISIVAKHENGEKSKLINDNISDGIVTGGILGGLAGLLIGAGSMVIPGLGIIAAAGPITGLLSGAVTGGVVGGLVDMGVPETYSKEYEQGVKEGKVLFSMKADDDKVDRISSLLINNNAEKVDSY